MKKHSHLCSEWNYARYEKASTLLEFYSSLITGSHNKIKAYYEKRFGENVFEGRWEACYKHCSRNVFVLCEFIGSRKGDVVVVNVNTGKRVKPARSLKPVTFAWSRGCSQSAAVRDTWTVLISTEQAAGRRNKESQLPSANKTSFHFASPDFYAGFNMWV